MKPTCSSGINRRFLLTTLAMVPTLAGVFPRTFALAQAADPLPSWNDGAAKQAVLTFVQATTDQSSANFVSPDARVATFDQDGTLWVEHPMYAQVMYCLDRVPAVARQRPELTKIEPFKTVLSGTVKRSRSSQRKSLKKSSRSRFPA